MGQMYHILNNQRLLIITVCLSYCYASAQHRTSSSPYLGAYSYSEGGEEFPFSQLNGPHLYSLGIDNFLPFPGGKTLALSKSQISAVANSNSVEKPVQEASEPAPQQVTGTAIIPLQPPPAVPVNAAAANVPTNNGAVFLGSGALGVINLGNGAFALGSGGIGYSNQRQQPRPNGRSPLFPPLPANPNLVPAARASQVPASIPQTTWPGFQYNQQLLNPRSTQKQTDQNGYERLDARSAGFGQPTPLIRALKTRMNFATLSEPQFGVQSGDISQLPQPGFGDPIPRLPPQALRYF
ncbi:hypothetical protein HUJ05_002139 [Dendroctonus ponderosae]|nr:hypothetical protein HUJ05_002139 [Dendroctonus ponderosae]